MVEHQASLSRQRVIFRTVGSLWLAALLLMLLLVAMGAATVFESEHGAAHALAAFYKSWWFKLLLGLIGLNVLAAVLARYPFSKRQTGFVITHTSILAILAGAWVTEQWGVDGQIGLAEGQTTREFAVRADTLSLARRSDQVASSVSLRQSVFSGFDPVERPKAPALKLEHIQVTIERYLPDSVETEEMVNDNPNARAAVQVSLSPTGTDEPVWLFAEQKRTVGPVAAAFRELASAEALQNLVSPNEGGASGASLVRVEHGGATSSYPLEECLGRAVAVRDSGYSFRVLRYMPHATVGPDKQVHSASDQPINPAIEVEVIGPAGVSKQLAFARFPDFQSMHGGAAEGLKITFVTPADAATGDPIEVISGPAGELFVRFAPPTGQPVLQPVELGTVVASPWPGLKFSVLRRFDRARIERAVQPTPLRQARTPAIQVRLATAEHENRMWLQKNRTYPVTIDGQGYTLAFGDRIVPLGFALRLDKFHIGTYPGLSRPRSFESHVTIEDAASGRAQSRVISMNHPVSFAGYTLYQSSYRQEGGHSVSFLSVARDPGQPIVFAGYIGLMAGMVVVLTTRINDRRRMARLMGQRGTGILPVNHGLEAHATRTQSNGRGRARIGERPSKMHSAQRNGGREERP